MARITFAAPTGDIDFELIEGPEAARQRIEQALRFWRGEHFIDRLLGVPWRQIVFQRPANAALVESVIGAAIRAVEGVRAVRDVSVSLDRATRTATYRASVETEDGPLVLAGSVGATS